MVCGHRSQMAFNFKRLPSKSERTFDERCANSLKRSLRHFDSENGRIALGGVSVQFSRSMSQSI